MIRMGKSVETECIFNGCQRLEGWKERGMTAKGYGVSMWGDKDVLKLWQWLHNSMNLLKSLSCTL